MLQVSTGIYFRDGVELHETEHRRPMFCNLQLIGRDQIDIGTGSMSPETSLATNRVTAVWVTLVERLEATRPDGTDEFLVSTGGEEMYEDLASILSFAFNAVFDLDHDRARQLIGERSRRPRTRGGAFISRMFDNDLRVTDEETEEARVFIAQLLALSRPEYERALRAVKRIVNAARRCAEDPTQAYTDYVASLEALSEGFDPPGLDWERLDSRKRKILNPAMQGLSPEQTSDIQAAILEAERAGSKHRFVEFVKHHLTPEFYREELPPHVRPIRPTSLTRALARAYQVRSDSVHSLQELTREAWIMSDGAHTVSPAGGDLMLTHEGLHRVCLHVVRSFVAQGPTQVDRSYNYRENLPNVVRMQLAPQFYMWHPENMAASTAHGRLDEVVTMFIEVLSKREDQLSADMRPALERVEVLLNGPMGAAPRRAMLASYFLWHELTHPDLHRPDSDKWVEVAIRELSGPSLESLAVAAVIDKRPPWSVDEWCELAEDRHHDLQRRKPQPVRPAIDALLWVETARALSSDGSVVEARAALARAVECMPGDPALVLQEREFGEGGPLSINLRSLVLGATRALEASRAPRQVTELRRLKRLTRTKRPLSVSRAGNDELTATGLDSLVPRPYRGGAGQGQSSVVAFRYRDRVWFREVEVPDELVEAATEGKLVLFVGAGASLDEPSSLPNFANLVRDVGARANRVPTDRDLERPDVFLGDLADLEIEVHTLVANAINKPDSRPNRLHEAIIDLARVHPNLRLVTTNYDLHLEGASRSKMLNLDVYRAPALPVGDDFTGIVHLHGALDQPPRKLVVTDKDFGHAYLREAWAARFLDRMFSAFSVVFIGYSHGDIVMQYLARSLGREGRRFVFTHEADSREWRRLGLRPVRYPIDGSSHLALVDGLERWAELTAWGRLAHRRRIAELVGNGPPTIPEEVSYLEQALGHPERVRYFTEQARGSDWLLWAANRPEFNRLFDPAIRFDDDRTVAQALTGWVVDQYVMDEKESPTALRLLRSRPWSPSTWDTLAHRLFAQEQRVPDWQVPWLVLVLHRAPADHGDLLDMLMCKESWQERPDLALMLLEHRTRPLPRPGVDFGPSSDAPRFEVAFAGDDHWLDEAWKKVFIPLLPLHAPDLLDLAVRQLRAANRLAGALQPGFDALSFSRSAIEPHSQDDFRDAADVLIDAARDSLEHLLHASPREAAAAVERLARAQEPILRRLAVHAWRQREDRTPDDKLRWILDENLLYDLDLQHEVYMLLEDTLVRASEDMVEAVLEHAEEGPQNRAEHSPYVPYNLLAWLHSIAPENAAIADEFTRLQEQNPEFAPREHPDLNMSMTSGFVENAEPFTRDELHELIASNPGEAYAAIRSYATADEFRLTGPTWTGALNALRGCVTHYPGDGIRLADVLAPDDSDVRDAIVRAWSAANLESTPEQASGVEPPEGNPPHRNDVTPDDVLRVIASWPMDAVRSAVANMFARGGTAIHPTAWHTLMPARRLAADLWPTTQVTGNVVDSDDQHFEAINHPAGDLAQFWMNVVAHEWRAHTDTWSGLPDELRAELDRMVQDQSRNGLLARVLLSTRLRFFTGADPAWASSRLMPLFLWDRDTVDPSEVRGLWRSFVQYGQYDDQILADGLLDAMLATMRRANDLDHDEAIAHLGRQLATVALKSSLDPRGWLSSLTTDAPSVLHLAWIRSVGRQLREMDPKDASAQWNGSAGSGSTGPGGLTPCLDR